MKEHALKISSAAIALIKKHQGLSLEKYRDEKGLWVIGYGHVIRDQEHFHGPVTPLEAETLLREDIRLCEALLRENMTRPLTQQQHDALVMIIQFRRDNVAPKRAFSGRRPGIIHGCLRSVFHVQPPEKRLEVRFYRGRTDVQIAANLFIRLPRRQQFQDFALALAQG